uniref:Uncharacterized protein n=1 Tax=Anopheles dirus TaxID=7168 RepID=A0A182NY24_9DIPT
MLLMWMMCPSTERFFMDWYASRLHSESATTLVSITSRMICVLSASSTPTPPFARPALFTSTSTPPNFSSTCRKAARMSSSFVMSQRMLCRRSFASLGRSFFSSSTRSTRRARPNVIIPAFAKAFTVAAPMPELAPVTTATFPAQRSILFGGETSIRN